MTKKSASPQSRRAIGLILGTLFTLTGLVLAAWLGPVTLKKANESESFVPTPAVVRSIDVEQHKTKNSRRHKVHIVFAYQVDGVEHLGRHWKVSAIPGFARLPSFTRRADADALAAQYPVGHAFEVYVDPQEPAIAVIERGGADDAWWMIGFGFVFGSIGLFLLWRGFARQVPTQVETTATA